MFQAGTLFSWLMSKRNPSPPNKNDKNKHKLKTGAGLGHWISLQEASQVLAELQIRHLTRIVRILGPDLQSEARVSWIRGGFPSKDTAPKPFQGRQKAIGKAKRADSIPTL